MTSPITIFPVGFKFGPVEVIRRMIGPRKEVYLDISTEKVHLKLRVSQQGDVTIWDDDRNLTQRFSGPTRRKRP